jgi:hypothetical protein
MLNGEFTIYEELSLGWPFTNWLLRQNKQENMINTNTILFYNYNSTIEPGTQSKNAMA